MKLRKTLKKGFTLVELIVVIAIIAILAAVSAVSYIAFINQANESADQQAVAQMNNVLQPYDAYERPESVTELLDLFDENGLAAKDYKPLFKDRFFFWDKDLNRVLYTEYNSGYKAIYPTQYDGRTQATVSGNTWYTLSGSVKKEEISVDNNKTTVYTIGQLATAIDNTSLTEITLGGNIDAMGAEITIDVPSGSNVTISGESAENPAILTNVTSTTASAAARSEVGYDTKKSKGHNCGFIGELKGSVTIENVTIENSTMGDKLVGQCGAVIGLMMPGSSATLKNVDIDNCSIYSNNKTGGFVGAVQGNGTLSLDEKCSITDTKIISTSGEAGKIIGAVYNNNSILTIPSTIGTAGTTVNLETTLKTYKPSEISADPVFKQTTGYINASKEKLVANTELLVLDYYYISAKEYRVFNSNAYFTLYGTTRLNESDIKVSQCGDGDISMVMSDGQTILLRRSTWYNVLSLTSNS